MDTVKEKMVLEKYGRGSKNCADVLKIIIRIYIHSDT